jgi:nitroreductase
MKSVSENSLNQLFLEARTCHAWQKKPVEDEILHCLYNLLKWAPTCVNGAPVRLIFVRDPAAKEKLASTLLPKNVEKTYEQLPRLMPHADYYSHFASDKVLSEKTSFRNSSLQGGYLIMAARAIGLDCGPMSGFDNKKLDSLFFAGTSWRSNFLCNLGYGDFSQNHPRSPRLPFEGACWII